MKTQRFKLAKEYCLNLLGSEVQRKLAVKEGVNVAGLCKVGDILVLFGCCWSGDEEDLKELLD